MIALHFVTYGLAPPALSPAVFYLLCASAMIPEGQKVDATLMNLGLDFINGFDEQSAEFLAPLLALRVSDSVRAQAGTRLATVLAAMGFQVKHPVHCSVHCLIISRATKYKGELFPLVVQCITHTWSSRP
jgi:hypothetical protein